jgi:hypothetical protein
MLGLGLGARAGGWAAPTAESLANAIPGLRVLALAGRGGMGAVYRAEQTRLGRTVAVKILPPEATAEPLARERLEREARVLAGLEHPGVLRVFDFGTLADGTSYLVMEWAEGGDLAARLAKGRVPWAEALGWVERIAAALDAAHARGVVHRDLKPGNVLLRADGSLALGDFGLARAEGAGFTTALTLSGVVYGTFDYMAPEQADGAGAVTKAVDVYALGVMTYQLLTGRVPRGVFEPASRVVGLPAAVDAVIAAALATEPGRRPESAGEFARRLRAAGARGRGKAWWLAAVALGLMGAAVVAARVWGMGEAGGRGATGGTETVPLGQAPREEARGGADPGMSVGAGTAPTPGPGGEAVSVRGGWTRRGEEWVVNEEVGLLRLAVPVPADFRYTVMVEFTRVGGRHSAGLILPTAAGTGMFELGAWEQGLGGFQAIDGRDLRANGTAFPAMLRNGERQRVELAVDGTRVGVRWNGVARGEVELRGRRLSIPKIWSAGGGWEGRLGLCAWQSPTVFHRVEVRAQ